jgi:hypothetical protein
MVLGISPKFRNKFVVTLLLFSRVRGKMIHEKKPKAKNLVILSLSAWCVLNKYKIIPPLDSLAI